MVGGKGEFEEGIMFDGAGPDRVEAEILYGFCELGNGCEAVYLKGGVELHLLIKPSLDIRTLLYEFLFGRISLFSIGLLRNSVQEFNGIDTLWNLVHTT